MTDNPYICYLITLRSMKRAIFDYLEHNNMVIGEFHLSAENQL